MLRAESHNPILDRLAEIERPAARVRIDVDPLRYDGVDQRQRRLFLSVLAVLGVIGFILVFGERTTGPPSRVWSVPRDSSRRSPRVGPKRTVAFEWQPIAGNPIAEVFDKWTVARACGPGGCDERSLDEWLEIGESLPTFVQAVAADSGLTINRDEFGDDHRVVEGTTAAETTIVYVAAFDDGWNFYVECGLSLGVRGDDRLIDEIVEVSSHGASRGVISPNGASLRRMSGCGRRTHGRRGRGPMGGAAQRDQLRRRAS